MKSESHLYALYFDENFSQRTVRKLLAMGYDCLTLREEGKAGRGYPDDLVLRDAAALSRVVVTLDRDFRRLHRGGEIPHQGIVFCTNDPDRERLAANIHAALSDQETMDGELINVYRPVRQ